MLMVGKTGHDMMIVYSTEKKRKCPMHFLGFRGRRDSNRVCNTTVTSKIPITFLNSEVVVCNLEYIQGFHLAPGQRGG